MSLRCGHIAHTDQKSGKTTYDLTFTRPLFLVTNGPYRMDDWTFKLWRLHMAASDYYWDKANVKCRTIDQIYADDPLGNVSDVRSRGSRLAGGCGFGSGGIDCEQGGTAGYACFSGVWDVLLFVQLQSQTS